MNAAAASTDDGASPATAAVAGQVHRQHVPAVVGQIAALQRPDAVVVDDAVDEDDGGFGGIEGLAAGVAVGAGAVDLQYMVRPLPFRRPSARA